MQQRPKILLTRPLFPEIIERLKLRFEVTQNLTDASWSKQQLIEKLQQHDGVLVVGMEAIDQQVLEQCPQLKIAANFAVGYNNLDLAAFKQSGVVATNTPGILTDTTADLGFALLMSVARRLSDAERYLRAKQWKRNFTYNAFLGGDLHHSTLAILGMGRIGQAIAKRGHFGFDMKIIYHNRSQLTPELENSLSAKYVTRQQLFEQADHLVVVMPYSPESHHSIGANEFAWMKSSATFVNIGRGGLVDENALISAIKTGHLAGAGLDVYEGEPNINPEFYQLENVSLTPHIGSATVKTRLAMGHLAADNLEGFFFGSGAVTPIAG